MEESYKFHYLMVKIFNDKPSLFIPKANLQTEKIPDLQDVVPQVGSIKHMKEMQHAQVVAVSDSMTLHKCIACQDGNINPIRGDAFGRCSECKTALKMDIAVHSKYPLY